MLTFPNVKINLGLNVVSRRPDGYHNIESIFCPVALTDVLEIAMPTDQQTDVSLIQSGLDCGVTDIEKNLCVKAYRALAQSLKDWGHTAKLPHVAMALHKVVPTGAGLGGGSSDATMVISQLNALLHLGLTADQMRAVAVKVGADCPFFVDNRTAYVSGIGDHLEPFEVSQLSGLKIVIVKPDVFVSTKEAYAGIVPQHPTQNVRDIVRMPFEVWRNELRNDFEPSVMAKCPIVAEVKDRLYNLGATYAQMSGSGASVFGLFKPSDPLPSAADFPNMFFWQGELN